MKKYIQFFYLSVFTMFFLNSCKMNNLGYATKTCIKCADDLYSMTITGDDGFQKFLDQGGASSADELAAYLNKFLKKGPYGRVAVSINPVEFGCTAFIVKNSDGKGGYLVGRNYDWKKCHALIIRNKPSDGYNSVSVCNLDFLGFGDDFVPEGIKNQIMALAGLYVPMDGINEKGLVVADLMAGDKEVTNQNTGKVDLTTTTAIRLLLNKAASVEEALELLNQYDIHSDIGTAHHFFIADAFGNSVVAEWIDGNLYAEKTDVLTNHYLCGEKGLLGIGSENSKNRFNVVYDEIEKANFSMDKSGVKSVLEKVKSSDSDEYEATQWSIVYDVQSEAPMQSLYWRSNFEDGAGILYSVE